jgi:serine/threonine-protein kinase
MTVSLKIFCGDGEVVRALRIGSRLDKYRLVKRLGYGGFATVYSALDQIENRHVAIKVPEEKYVADAASLKHIRACPSKSTTACPVPLTRATTDLPMNSNVCSI